MSTSKVVVRTAVPPERFIRSLTDFGPTRSEVWGNSDAGYLKVHDQGDTWADVTEGSGITGGVWQRYRYDWSQPEIVRLDVTDSNAFGPGSFWEYHVTAEPGGGSRIVLRIHRVPCTLKGRLLDIPLAIAGGRFYFGKDLRRTVRRLERTDRGA